MFITLFLFEMLCRFSAIPWVFEPPFSQIEFLGLGERNSFIRVLIMYFL